jgi:transposase-like protein
MSLEVNMNNQLKRPNPKFTLEFKQDAVKLITEKGYTHQQMADSLGLSLSAIGRWSRAERGPASPSSTKTVTVLCRVMEVGASAFYAWLKTPEDTDKAQRKTALEAKARQLFNGHKQTYGYRRLSN